RSAPQTRRDDATRRYHRFAMEHCAPRNAAELRSAYPESLRDPGKSG
ncbi:hypothetical protein QF035_011253, partial [Streptomyces umbrinus]|nr:hypothetical protein [Streptomyces umbrinus]